MNVNISRDEFEKNTMSVLPVVAKFMNIYIADSISEYTTKAPDILSKQDSITKEQMELLEQLIIDNSELPPGSNKGIVAMNKFNGLKRQANSIVKRDDVKKHVCAALQSVSHDVYDTTKIVMTVLLSASFSGSVIPQNPVLYAIIGLLIFKAGVAGFCADYPVKDRQQD